MPGDQPRKADAPPIFQSQSHFARDVAIGQHSPRAIEGRGIGETSPTLRVRSPVMFERHATASAARIAEETHPIPARQAECVISLNYHAATRTARRQGIIQHRA
jgi:hypothetical protein